MTIRVMIVDDHPAVREGLATRVSSQPGMEVCGEASDVGEAMKLLSTARPDVAVVDIHLKSGNGLDLVKRIRSREESIGVLVWSMHPDSLYAPRALNAGALGYINKDQTTDRIVEAIRRVSEGKVYLCPEMTDQMLSLAVGRRPAPGQSPVQLLSNRELEVFRMIGDGLTASQIAMRLHLSHHTVETHRQRIKRKLNLETANDLTRTATRWVLQGE